MSFFERYGDTKEELQDIVRSLRKQVDSLLKYNGRLEDKLNTIFDLISLLDNKYQKHPEWDLEILDILYKINSLKEDDK